MFSRLITAAAVLLATTAETAPTVNSKFTYYNALTPDGGPCDLCTGPDGAIWAQYILSNKIARVDPASGDVEEYDIPYTLPPVSNRTAFACAIQPGSDGNLYAATGVRNQFLKIVPSTKNITVFTPPPPNPAGNLQPLNDLYTGPDGMFFSQTTGNVITQFDYKTETFRNYNVPTAAAGPLGMIYSGGYLWFTELTANKIARLEPVSGNITEYDCPLTLATPSVMRAATQNGKYLFFTAFTTNAIGRITTATGEFKTYTNPSALSFPTEDTVDNKGNVWFSTATQNTLNKLNPKTGVVTTTEQPGTLVVAPISVPPAVDIAMHYDKGTNSMWFTEVANNRIGRYQLG